MRAAVSWIAEHVELPAGLTGRELGEALIRVGLEVERVESAADGVSGPIVVGRVASHRGADRVQEADPVLSGGRGRSRAPRHRLRRPQLRRG